MLMTPPRSSGAMFHFGRRDLDASPSLGAQHRSQLILGRVSVNSHANTINGEPAAPRSAGNTDRVEAVSLSNRANQDGVADVTTSNS